MPRNEQYELLLQRSSEFEDLARIATDVSIRQKCAELAVEYRVLAEQLIHRDPIQEQLA